MPLGVLLFTLEREKQHVCGRWGGRGRGRKSSKQTALSIETDTAQYNNPEIMNLIQNQ